MMTAIAFLVGSIAIVLLRIRNELFLWLAMTLATVAVANVLSEVGGARYTVGWLTARLTWIISGCVLFLYFLRQFARQLNQLVVSDSALQASEQNFQMLVQGLKNHAIYMLDPEGRVTSWNPGAEYIEGYGEKEIIGQHFSRFYTPEDRQSGLPAAALKQAKQKGKYEAEGWRVRKDGSRFWASVVINPIFGKEGAFIGFAKIYRDLTEKRLVQNALDQARQAKDHVLAIASHDLRQPLQTLFLL